MISGIIIFGIATFIVLALAFSARDASTISIKDIWKSKSNEDKLKRLKFAYEIIKDLDSITIIAMAINLLPSNDASWLATLFLIWGLIIYIVTSVAIYNIEASIEKYNDKRSLK